MCNCLNIGLVYMWVCRHNVLLYVCCELWVIWGHLVLGVEVKALAAKEREGKTVAQAKPGQRNEYLARRFTALKAFVFVYITTECLKILSLTICSVFGICIYLNIVKAAGEIPEPLSHAFDNAANHPLGFRKRQTQIVNEALGPRYIVYVLQIMS